MTVSIIIPTYNRLAKLQKVLPCLAKQTCPVSLWEVIIIDDGSTDGTVNYLEKTSFPFTLKVLRQEHQGPWPARNWGARESKEDILLFLDDDIYAEPQLITEHIKMLSGGEEKLAGVRGHLLNWPEREITPFLKFFDRHSAIEFFEKRHNKKIAFNFFACANQSIKRKIFEEMQGFHPDFAGYGWADMELALRLIKAGYYIRYNKNAAGWHDTSPTLESFCRRQEVNGWAANLFYKHHREMQVKLITRRSQVMLRLNRFLEANNWLLDFNRRLIKRLEKRKAGHLLYFAYNWEISYYYYKGMREGIKKNG